MEIIKTRVESHSIDYAIRESIQDLLPEEIRRNNLTNWILKFDALGKREQSRDYWQEEREDSLNPFLEQIVETSLTPNVSFYFASLFHIGREWQVAEKAIKAAEKALQGNNLEATINQNITLFEEQLRNFDVPEREHQAILSEALSDIFQITIKRHSQKIKKAQNWWSIWQGEVKKLENITERSTREFNNYNYEYGYDRRHGRGVLIPPSLVRLMTFSFQNNRLYHLFTQEGIEFKGTATSSFKLNPLMNLLLESMLVYSSKDDYHRHELQSTLESFGKLLREMRYADIVQPVESRLLRKFRGENPFEKYSILQSSPDTSLKDLWNQCKLPNGERFYYAQNWLDSLESSLSFGYYESLPFISTITDEHINSYARTVDSTIKRKWVSANRGDQIGKTDAELIQNLFEQECIVELVKGAVYPTRKKKGEQKWNVDNFRETLERVIQFLNERGYNLETPSKARLERLWDLAIKDNIYGRTEW